jgi:hypothetical protein
MIVRDMMRRQTSLLDGPVKRTHHAAAFNPEATRLRQVHDALEKAPDGATAEELADTLHLRTSQVSPALSELRAMGEVRKTEATRPTRSGGRATVWMIVRAR